jgi:hypothetical protein
MTLKQKSLISLLLIAASFLFITAVLAQTQVLTGETANDMTTQNQAFLGSAGLGTFSIGVIVAYGIRILLSLLGLIFVVLIIYAGFLWMTAAGNEEKIKKSKDIMIAAVIGLAIVLSAYAITIFVFDKLLFGTGVDGGTGGYTTGH